MKKLLFWLCIMVNYAIAQPQITWLKQYDTAYTVNTGSDNIVELSDTSYTLLVNYQGKHKIIHLDEMGDTVWTKTYGTNFFADCLIKTTDGGYAMLGYINGVVLIKTDSIGDTLWTKPHPQLSDPRVIQTSDNGFAISSYSGINFIKTDSIGNFQWFGNSNQGIHALGVIECFNKEYLVFGNSGFNPYTYKAALFDSTGLLKWVNAYGYVTYLGADLESILSAVQLPDSNFIFGCSIDTSQQGQYHLLKVKYSDGTLLDSVKFTDHKLYGYCYLFLGNASRVFIYDDQILKKMDFNLNTIWKKGIPFRSESMSFCNDGGIIASGINVDITGKHRIEYAKLDSLGNIYNFQGIPNITPKLLSVYPNPAANQLTISSDKLAIGKSVTVTIYDVLGKVQMEEKTTTSNIDISSLAPGIYMLQMQQGDKIFNGRFVKE